LMRVKNKAAHIGICEFRKPHFMDQHVTRQEVHMARAHSFISIVQRIDLTAS
jgi:hypothetical protein